MVDGPWTNYPPTPDPTPSQVPEQGPWNNYAPPQPEMNTGPWNKYVAKNISDLKSAQKETQSTAPDQPPETPHPAQDIFDAMKAGWQTSVSGLLSNRKLPDTVLPEDAPTAMRIAAQASTIAGDLPAMIAGGVMGGAAGSEVPVVGNAMGATFGAWAMPSAMRRYYIDRMQKGEVSSFSDFFERTAGALFDGVKSGTVGMATEGLGNVAGAAAPIAGQALAKTGAQLATMTTLGKAMEGQVPEPKDFLDSTLMLLGMHGAVHLSSELPTYAKNTQAKLQEIFAATGHSPVDVATQAVIDPVLKQDLLSSNPQIPKQFQDMAEKPQPNQELLGPQPPKMVDAEIPKELNDMHPTLDTNFDSGQTPKVQKPEEETPATPPENPEEPKTDTDKILASIGEVPEKKSRGWDNIYTQTVDKFNPINKLAEAISGGEKLPKGQDPYALFSTSLSRGFAKADEVLNHGYLDENGNKRDGLKQIFERHDNPEELKAYGMAKRAIELNRRGIESGIDLEAAKNLVDKKGPEYEKSFQDIVDLQNTGLKTLKDSGFFTDSQFQKIMDQNKDYFPMGRAVEGGGGGKGTSNPIKSIKGSSAKVIDPVEQIIKNQYAYYRMAEENTAKQSILALGKEYDAPADLLSKVKTPMKGITVQPEEVASYLTKYGIQEGDPDSFNIFRPMSVPLKENEFAVMVDGKRQVYETDPSVAKALSATAYTEPNAIVKIAAGVAHAQRLGITENPFFLLTHAIRDQFSATIQSNNGYRFAWDGLRGLSHYFSKSDDFMEFMRNGGGMSTLADFDQKYVKNDVWSLSKETGLLDKTLNVIKTPLELQRALAQAVFTAPKMGEYLRAKEAGKDSFTAAYEGRNVTVDVQKRGANPLMGTLNTTTPFFNMRLQGMDRLAQAFQENPQRTATKMAVGITLTSLATWWTFKDDPRYRDAPDWEKDLYWILPIGDEKTGTTMRIPKPFEPGLLFGSLAERTMQEFYNKKPDAFKGFGGALLGGAIPNFIPPVAMAPMEQFANRSWLTGGNIVPRSLEGVAPEYQYNPYTTETAKTLGKMISYIPGLRDIGHGNVTLASPMVIENYIRSWSGNTGLYAIQLADKALETAGINPPKIKPASTLADIPYIKSFFVRYPSSIAQPVQDFFDNFDKAQTANTTLKHLANTADPRALEFIKSAEYREHMGNMISAEKALTNQNKMIQLIYANPQMTKDEKRQQIDGLYYTMIQTATGANKVFDELKKIGTFK